MRPGLSLWACYSAGNRRSTLQTYVRMAVDAAASQLRGVEVALGGIQVQGATVDAHVHGEALPRRFEDVAVVRACCLCLPCLPALCLARLAARLAMQPATGLAHI